MSIRYQVQKFTPGWPHFVGGCDDTGGYWEPYRNGRLFKEESGAYRLMDRLVRRWPMAEDNLRVARIDDTQLGERL